MRTESSHLVVAVLLFITPLFFWTLTPNTFATPKEIFFIITTTVALLVTAISFLKHRSHSLPRSPLTALVGIFIISIASSLIANPEGCPEALASKGLMLILLPMLSLFILSIQNISKLIKTAAYTIVASSTVLSLHSILSLTFLAKSPYLPTYMQSLSFTPSGSYLTTLTLIVIGLSLSIYSFKQGSQTLKNLAAGLMILHIIATVAIVSLMLPNSALTPSLLSYQASWSIALDALKSLRSLFLGIGLSNYSLLFTSVKPVSVNLSTLWNALPITATSELLTLLPTAGVFTTLSFLFLMIKGLVWSRSTILFAPFALTSLALLTLPGSLPLYLLFFVIIALSAPRGVDSIDLSPTTTRFLSGILAVISLATIYIAGRGYASEILIRLSQKSLDAGDSKSAYEYHIKAIRLSPKTTNYHLSFAEINFRLATALSQKSDLSDKDRETITSLIQQSIQSGKTAISLRPNSATAWITVAKIYENLINVADGADNFTLEAYSRALSLDRANPLLRLEYANLLAKLSASEKAVEKSKNLRDRAKVEMQTAIQLKSDYANAYYNLSKLYEADQDLASAYLAMQQSVKYLDQSSNDYQMAQAELQTLKSKLPSSSPLPVATVKPESIDSLESLSTPPPLPSPLPGGPLELPVNN